MVSDMKIYSRILDVHNTLVGQDLWFYSALSRCWYRLTDEARGYYIGYQYAGRSDMREWMLSMPREYRLKQKASATNTPRYYNRLEYDPVFDNGLRRKEFLTTDELFGLDEETA